MLAVLVINQSTAAYNEVWQSIQLHAKTWWIVVNNERQKKKRRILHWEVMWEHKETYWRDTRCAKHQGHYRSCNGGKVGGRNSTKNKGANPETSINREMWTAGTSGRGTERVWQQGAASEPLQDHESDQEESDDKENLLEASPRADRLEFIREFQEIMNKAIEELLNKPVRRHTYQKKINLNWTWNRRSIGKPYARKQTCLH